MKFRRNNNKHIPPFRVRTGNICAIIRYFGLSFGIIYFASWQLCWEMEKNRRKVYAKFRGDLKVNISIEEMTNELETSQFELIERSSRLNLKKFLQNSRTSPQNQQHNLIKLIPKRRQSIRLKWEQKCSRCISLSANSQKQRPSESFRINQYFPISRCSRVLYLLFHQ